MTQARNKIRKANPRRRPFAVADYLALLEEYKQLILSTITSSWKLFCERQDRETVWDGIYRVIRKQSKTEGDRLLRSPIDQKILSPRDSAELLANTFYPWDDPSEDSPYQEALRETVNREIDNLAEATTPKFTLVEIECVLNGMSPKKSPGEDGLTSDICSRAFRSCPAELLGLYNKCLDLSYFPKIWKRAVIKILPKPHKEDYTAPKSYRPIGLLPILGKALEKLFTNRIMWQIGRELNPNQYGFMPQKSTEDALYEAVAVIESAVQSKRIAVAVSLDIEGAFDNAWWPAVKNQLLRMKLDPSITRLVSSYLSDRSIAIKYSGELISRSTNKGCIQGSTCGPLLWNILLDSLLRKTSGLKAHVQAFADDILVIGTGAVGEVLEDEVNTVLQIISEWGAENKLRFAPRKTQVMVFTRKLKYYKPRIRIAGIEICPQEKLKVLGLTLDKNLNYVEHIKEVTNKAINLYKGTSRAARAHWGLNSEILKSIYTSVVEPTMLYAANVWGPKSQTVQVKTRLDKVVRMFGIQISKGHRTVSLNACTMLASILPLDLRALERRELYLIKKGKSLDHLPGRLMETLISPFDLPHPSERSKIEFGTIDNIEESKEGPYVRIYTDGSKIEGKVGAAVTFWRGEQEIRYRMLPLASYCSVYQAELCAILGAVETMVRVPALRKATIYSDSRSALECIKDPSSLHPIVSKIREQLKELREAGGEAVFSWIRAHAGIPGNERADELAKQAALKCKTAPIYDRFPESLARYVIRDQTVAKWQERYSESKGGEVTKRFFPNVREAFKTLRSIKRNNLVAQLLTGHGGFKAYLHRFKLSPHPFCACDGASPETVEHVIIHCPRFSRDRYDCECRMGVAIDAASLDLLVGDDKCRSEFLAYATSAVRMTALRNGAHIPKL